MDLTIKISPELAEFIRQKVESGAYGSASEVVDAALQLLVNVDYAQAAKLEQLRKDIHEGLTSGPNTPWDSGEIKKLGLSKLTAKANGK